MLNYKKYLILFLSKVRGNCILLDELVLIIELFLFIYIM